MASDRELMNRLAKKSSYLKELNESERAELKQTLLEIYIYIASICEKHNLVYMLSGGSCLGAVRHQGFIPWDDDLDVMMPRSSYDKLIELYESGVLSDDYIFEYPHRNKDSKTGFLKIYKRGTILQEIFDDCSPYTSSIYIDIFAIDRVPKCRFMQSIKGLIANGLNFIAIQVRHATYPSRYFREFASLDKEFYRQYKIKMLIGRIFSIIPHRFWVYRFDKFVASTSAGNLMGIPTGRKYYNGEIFEQEVFLPPIKAKFEGLDVYIPANYDAYLTNLYKNYMELPPVEKRERHFYVDFGFKL